MGTPFRFPLLIVLAAGLLLTACAETKIVVHTAKRITGTAPPPEASPPSAPAPVTGRAQQQRVKIGKPYEVAGVWYYPKADPNYGETGIASWYGEPFHGRTTANGETYDMNQLTAAHKTLQLSANVRVTNLENGRSLVLRLNDRGPFVHGRIIDVSRRAAQLLGFERQGTARVRVEAEGGRILPKPVTPEPERTAIAAVPREPITAEALPPPPGVRATPQPVVPDEPKASPAPVQAAVASEEPLVSVVPVQPTQIFVQAGAFAFKDNAQRLRAVLNRIGPTTISVASINGREFYRVRIGPIGTVNMADTTLEKVIRSGYPGARIVVD